MQRTLSLWLCPSTVLKQQLRSALVAGQWRGDTALTLPLFWRQSTISPVFFGRYPRSSHYSFVPPSLPIPNMPSRFCGRKAKCTPPLVSRLNLDTLETRRTVTKTTMMYKLTSSQDDISPNPHTHRKTSSRSSWRACRNILMGRYVYPMSYREPDWLEASGAPFQNKEPVPQMFFLSLRHQTLKLHSPYSAQAETLHYMHTPSIAFQHLPPKEGCRKPVLWVCTTCCSISGPGLQNHHRRLGKPPHPALPSPSFYLSI